MASAGCKKNEGVPVDEKVEEIFLPTIPDLPIPVITTLPLQFKIKFTAFSKFSSNESLSLFKAFISSSIVFLQYPKSI